MVSHYACLCMSKWRVPPLETANRRRDTYRLVRLSTLGVGEPAGTAPGDDDAPVRVRQGHTVAERRGIVQRSTAARCTKEVVVAQIDGAVPCGRHSSPSRPHAGES